MKQLLAACLVLLVGPTSLAPAQDVIRTFQPEPDAVIVPEPEPRPRAPRPEPSADTPVSLPPERFTTARIDLPERFEPDPQRVRVRGRTSVEAASLERGCRGFVSDIPQLTMTYVASGLPLFLSASGNAASLLVETPSGEIACARQGRAPTLPQRTFGAPGSGSYRIWLVRDEPDQVVSGELTISEHSMGGSLGRTLRQVSPSSNITLSDRVRIDARPALGTVDIWQAMNAPVRWNHILSPGERINLRGDTSCTGYVETSPVMALTAQVGNRVDLYTDGGLDTVIFARAPDGRWLCNDDGAVGFNVGLEISIGSGEIWQIFLGTYRPSSSTGSTTLVLQASSMIQPIASK
jgi:hypothetical protein